MKPGKYLATTYSHRTYRPTTIGAEAFHFRVRNGTGWFRFALVTRGQSQGRAAGATRVWNWDSGDFEKVDGGWWIVDGQILLPINNQLSTINLFSAL
jgi:RimJ/RimL family protein N-acetyltransferase